MGKDVLRTRLEELRRLAGEWERRARDGTPSARATAVAVLDRSLHELRAAPDATEAGPEGVGEGLSGLLFENCRDALFLTVPDGTILRANPAACRLFGYSEAEFQALGRSAIVDPDDPRLGPALAEREGTGTYQGELSLRRRDGTRLSVEVTSQVFRGRCGQRLTSMVVRDLTARRLLEHALRDSEARFRALYESIGTGIALCEATAAEGDFVVRGLNRAAQRIGGVREADVLGRRVAEVFPGLEACGLLDGLRRVARTGEAQCPPVAHCAGRGRSLWIGSCAFRLPSGEVAVAFEDVTARKEAEQEVRRNAERVRRLSTRLRELETEERRRLARELHDRVGQNISALGLQLSLVAAELAASGAARRVEDCLRLLEETGSQIRDVTAELRPAVLDDFGLRAALRWQCGLHSQRTGVPASVEGPEFSPRLAPDLEMALFRVAQEALANAAKHARASRIEVLLEHGAGTCQLTVSDDGVGFHPGAARGPGLDNAWGLSIMKERMEAVDGRLSVESAPGKGTRVIAQVAC